MDAGVSRRAGAAPEKLDVVIRDWIAPLIERAHHELLPLVDLRARLLASPGRIVDPLGEGRLARHLKRGVHQIDEIIARISQYCPVVFAVDRDERNVDVLS